MQKVIDINAAIQALIESNAALQMEVTVFTYLDWHISIIMEIMMKYKYFIIHLFSNTLLGTRKQWMGDYKVKGLPFWACKIFDLNVWSYAEECWFVIQYLNKLGYHHLNSNCISA